MEKNEHDFTKLMLETLRGDSGRLNLINEFQGTTEEPTQELDSSNSGDDNFKSDFSDNETHYYDSQEEEFKKNVDAGAVITDFSIDETTQNVTLGGLLDMGLEFSYSTKGGVQLGTPEGSRFVTFAKENVEVLNTLLQNYDIWKRGWQDKFNEESTLKPKNDN